MDIDSWQEIAPWNWFKKEQEEQQNAGSLSQRNDLPAAGGPVSPILQLHHKIDRLLTMRFEASVFPAAAATQVIVVGVAGHAEAGT